MPNVKPLSLAAVEALGAKRLAALLLEAAEYDPALMRSVRFAVASRIDAAAAAAEIDQQIRSFRRDTAFVDYHKRMAFARDLGTLVDAIAGPLADLDPAGAFARMLDFIAIAPTIFERSDDDGTIGGQFQAACAAVATLLERTPPSPTIEDLARRGYALYLADDYGVADGLVAALAKGLDAQQRATLQSWIEADLVRLPAAAAQDDMSARGCLDARRLNRALADVADAEGDVDGYCAAQQLMGPRVRNDAGMARRLLDTDRPAEALAILTAAEPNPAKNATELADLRIAVLDALGRSEEAQALRWSEFERGLRAEPLRAYLKRLSDFADVEKEEEALDLVTSHPDVQGALAFLTTWPDLRRAGALVRARFDAINGNCWWALTPAAERLENKEPLAASLLYRRMIDFTLDHGYSQRYVHTARHLLSCAGLASLIADWQGHQPHAEYAAGLRQRHPRKSSFWSRVDVPAKK
jgi:hypothetical protein